ncbi:hypothetical protein MKMG_02141 [Methanogenium sp. MK-MG]|nr:hypothetical protein MKMG_02141 [Methanogenium sp. MK-MG]
MMTGPDIAAFFQNEGIELFTEVGIADIPTPDRDYVCEFLSGAGSVVIFAKEIPALVYRMPPKEKTREMLKIAAAGGLGEIDKSTLLITPQYEPRVFLSGVVTGREIPVLIPLSGQKNENFDRCSG